MTSHGNAKVRPDGLVNVSLALTEENYKALFAEAKAHNITMGDLADDLIDRAGWNLNEHLNNEEQK